MAEVLTGFWSDYDKAPPFRTILTVTYTQANFIISALSFFLASLILPMLWEITINLIYFFRCTRPDDQNYEIKQRRIILRNATRPSDAFTGLLKSFWSWRKTSTASRRPLQLLRLLTLALGGTAVITLGGIVIPPLISSKVTENVIVLAKSDSCGFLRVLNTDPDLGQVATGTAQELEETIDARRYAAEFYGNPPGTIRTLSQFPVQSLPYEVDTSAACPFSEEMCLLGPDGSISFDTGYLDSHKHLGINARAQDRIQYRWKSTCTPLNLTESLHIKNPPPGSIRDDIEVLDDLLFEFWLGPQDRQNYTFSYHLDPLNRNGYQVQTASAFRGFSDARNLSWTPISMLNRTDADVSLILIAPNMIGYASPVNDVVFQANGTKRNPVRSQDKADQLLFLPDFVIRFIACADQHEFCNPNTGVCSGLEGLLGPVTRPFGNNIRQLATCMRINQHGGMHTMQSSVKTLGSQALIAKKTIADPTLISPGLPDGQWHRETRLWFETGLARLQANTNRFGNTRPPSGDEGAYELVPAENVTGNADVNAAMAAQCGEQRMLSQGQVQNFSLFRMVVLVVTCLVLVGAGKALSCLGRRLSADGHSQWEEDGLLAIWKKSVDPSQHWTWNNNVILSEGPETVGLSSLSRPSSA